MTKYKINYHKYLTGAGVLLLENYNNSWIVILFKDHTKKYSDIGGTYESKHIDIKDTAMDELAEESRKIFILDNKKLLQKYVDVKYDSNKDDFYRTYLLNITNDSFFNYEINFYKNKKIIDMDKSYSNCWKETTKMKRFYLTDLLRLINKRDLNIKDIYGKRHKIRRRVKDIMKNINNITNFNKYIPNKININKLNNSDDTITYYLY